MSIVIKRAILSVYDKTGIVDFARALNEKGIEIISTGGTYSLLQKENIPVKSVAEVTEFPEILNGRVKTLHPSIAGAILTDKNNPEHLAELKKHNIEPIDLVVVNLYPFTETVAKGSSEDEIIEEIDIGGVTLIREAAKNFKSVNVLVDKSQYENYLNELNSTSNNISTEYSKKLAAKAFDVIAEYDTEIRNYFNGEESKQVNLKNSVPLRYGENPHQEAVLYKDDFDVIFKVLHGKELSYNNLLDTNFAYEFICEFENENPACIIVKHGNPSGVAIGDSLLDAYKKAFATDTVSPFGGIIIFNKKLDLQTAEEVDKLFSEIILAPEFDEKALELLQKKKNRRLIQFNFSNSHKYELKKIAGGYLYQGRDNVTVTKENLKTVTDKQLDEKDIEDVIFANKVVKYTKSNAVVFIKDKRTLGIGAGQPSRIDSTKIAVSKAKEFNNNLEGSIAASDAFFPFADGLLELTKAGAKTIVQPGGSVRDEEVIKAANENNITMVFTGIRHFKH
ncbi:MAG: bifunctional phosphoribosylaminoimidazolecarboxamide formyltransferase/IMP cyclohydrolase [Bacteroidetes bacterium]|nr:bifunctional phosphoribosylaminoimidazolecarboxamide formyltransferase/IMP cyclohydrolase [Bacteroidota bacterium]